MPDNELIPTANQIRMTYKIVDKQIGKTYLIIPQLLTDNGKTMQFMMLWGGPKIIRLNRNHTPTLAGSYVTCHKILNKLAKCGEVIRVINCTITENGNIAAMEQVNYDPKI